MTAKPPERIRVITNDRDRIFTDQDERFDLSWWDEADPLCAPHTDHFYVLEKEPMEKKTENLTTEEAWVAMARGECVKTNCHIHTIRGGTLQWWSSQWISTPHLEAGPYSIVPDPSKPKEVEVNEYQNDKEALLDNFDNSKSFKMATRSLIEFIERNFERKP